MTKLSGLAGMVELVVSSGAADAWSRRFRRAEQQFGSKRRHQSRTCGGQKCLTPTQRARIWSEAMAAKWREQ